MADFRRLFYALALVAMLAGLTIPASAQTAPFQCIANAGVPPIVRAEGYTELVGDVVLNCTGGVPTAPTLPVPPVNITIFLNTNITSRLTGTGQAAFGGWSEALLIVDEPHSAGNPTVPLLNCGAAGAPDNTVSGPGVCALTGNGQAGAATQYNGAAGHPNVFQAQTGSVVNSAQFNAVTWNGVPLDPPGSTTTRTLRFTNIRANAFALGVSSTFAQSYIQAQISISGQTSVSINNPQQIVAYVQKGLTTAISSTSPLTAPSPQAFLQCTSQNASSVTLGPGTVPPLVNTSASPTFVFTEGFASSFKARNISLITNQAGNGTFSGSYWHYNAGSFLNPPDFNQNVPGAIYNTETGFENSPTGTAAINGQNVAGDPNPNPPLGIGTIGVNVSGNAFAHGVSTTGIETAGQANAGTRLAVQISSVPTGVTLFVPTAIALTNNGGTTTTGIAVLVITAADGSGSYTPASTAPSTTSYVALSGGLAVYEVLFADPFSVESATVTILAGWVTNLSTNSPAPGVTAQAIGSFAPFYSTAAANNASSSLPVPRFGVLGTPANIFSIVKCACDILFPWVVSAGGFDTGIALANTSLDPGAAFGFGAAPQQGTVQFWYYGVGGAPGGPPPGTQCTNTTSPGTCPGTTLVPAGQVLTYVLSQGSAQWGLDNRGAAFYGYVIAQAGFQYCHAFAYISALGAGPLTTGISEGYLGLILDKGGLARTGQTSENLQN